MSSTILEVVGKRRLFEGLIEATAPITLALGVYLVVVVQLSRPTAGRVLTDLEVFLMLAGPTVALAWAFARIAFIAGMRTPWKFLVLNLLVVTALIGVTPWVSSFLYQMNCREAGGKLQPFVPFTGLEPIDLRAVASDRLNEACVMHTRVPGLWLPGALLRPPWRGLPQLMPLGWLGLTLAMGLATLALRDRRLRRTRFPNAIWDHLRLTPAGGSETAFIPQRMPKGNIQGRWDSCANPTVWGELCGQLYPAAYVFAAGEACARCGLRFKPAPLVSLAIVSLRYGDIDYLNNLDSREARIWKQSMPQPRQPETLEPRWVLLGEIQLPDVLSVSQALALTLEWIATLEPEDAATTRAVELARRQASRLAAWAWFAEGVPNLKRGIPTRDVRLAIGAQRLRDLYGGRSGWKGLQLDIGLVPVDLRLGLWKPPEVMPGETGQATRGQRFNNRQVFWLPVSSVALSNAQGGVWVPRVEGAGLRAWLTLTSRQAYFKPAPYFWNGAPWSAGIDFSAAHDLDAVPLSLVRIPPPEEEPLTHDALLGCRLSEWDWLDRRHLELLRRQAVFMAPYELSRWDLEAPVQPAHAAEEG